MSKISATAFRLQIVTVGWVSLEAGVALVSAARSHSPALLAFGSDSVVELLSAVVVLLPWITNSRFSERTAGRLAALLLFALALVVAVTAGLSLGLHLRPEPSRAGVAITAAALLMMPILSTLKRRQARQTGNVALSADSIQSATCAWIALFALIGLVLNALFHIAWFDSVAALAIIPLLIREGRSAIKGEVCSCAGNRNAC